MIHLRKDRAPGAVFFQRRAIVYKFDLFCPFFPEIIRP